MQLSTYLKPNIHQDNLEILGINTFETKFEAKIIEMETIKFPHFYCVNKCMG
jgi:hypothetical protein